MYDHISLERILVAARFDNVHVVDFTRSSIPDWASIGLDLDDKRREYKPDSLYVEASKPSATGS
jgi:hypothetical protein